jgi:hypothetical protein
MEGKHDGFKASLGNGRNYKLQTRPVVRERAPQGENQSNFLAKERKKENLGMGSKGVPDTKTY